MAAKPNPQLNGVAVQLEFPARRRARSGGQDSASGAAGELDSGRLKERLRTHVSSWQTRISVAASHGLDLDKLREVLTAPSLSFDWEAKGMEEEEEGSMWGSLEVDVPEAEKRASSRPLTIPPPPPCRFRP